MAVSSLSLTLALVVDFVYSHLRDKERKLFLKSTTIDAYLVIPTANSEIV